MAIIGYSAMYPLVILNCLVCVAYTLHLPSTVILGFPNTTRSISLGTTGGLHENSTGPLYVFFGKVETVLTTYSTASNNRCPPTKQKFHLLYTNYGDDIKASAYNRLIFYAKARLEEIKDGDDWDAEIGLEPIRWGIKEYWLLIDQLNEWNELTWHWVKDLLELLEYCFVRGHREEFEARLYYGSSKLARIRMYFYREPEPDRAIS